jgi:D-amino-acid oxidase
MEITIIGSGVIGLTTALTLSESGHKVTVRTWKLPPFTTSDKAAAFWSPYRIGEDALTFSWIAETYTVLKDISEESGSGVSMIALKKFLKDGSDQSDLWWLHAIPEGAFTSLSKEALPEGYEAGWTARVPLMETPVYLPYLIKRLEDSGGNIISGEKITDIDSLLDGAERVINCTGLGSRELVGDHSLSPVRGQIAVVDAPGLDAIYVDADSPSYLVPRADGCIVGGTYEKDAWEETSDTQTIASMLKKAPGLLPGDYQRVIRTYAGLRPYRPTVRLEVDPLKPRLIHNYGHGGAGFTLSWGTASRVAQLLCP